jgi:adenylate kinase
MAAMNAALTAVGRTHANTAGPVLVAVIGPPGAGKSTVVAALANRGRLPVFRLRETIRTYPQLLADLAPSPDPLGWVSLEAVRRVLHAAFVEQRRAVGPSAVLLDNFPGTAGQLALLTEFAGLIGGRVAVLEIRAELLTVVARVAERRVCLVCGPDSHAPAVPADDDPEQCSACGTTLSRRVSDVPRLHGLRLARYAANLPEITELAAERGVQHLMVNADHELPEVCRLARHALNQLISLAPFASANPLGSRP